MSNYPRDVSASGGAAHSCLGGISNMINDTQRNKSIDSIRKQLHAAASQPPREDPFSRVGYQAWQDWTDICRGFEAELRQAGEVF